MNAMKVVLKKIALLNSYTEGLISTIKCFHIKGNKTKLGIKTSKIRHFQRDLKYKI